MTITVTEHEDGASVAVKGAVDLHNAPELRTALFRTIGRVTGEVLVALDGVTYMDSAGVATLIRGLHNANKRGVGFALTAPSPAVTKLFELFRLDCVFEARPG